VGELTVDYAWGGKSRLTNVGADRIVEIAPPKTAPPRTATSTTPLVVGCTQAGVQGQSIARLWDEAAVQALRAGNVAAPVQARDLLDVSTSMRDAYAAEKANAGARNAAISFAAYRVLVWRASFGTNLSKTFALLTERLRSLCYSPDFTSTAGDSPAALGNRIAAAAIAAGRHDGSLEALHYVDTSYVPMNGPLVVSGSGSTVHDPTFWQPLALGQVAANGLAPIPAKIQSFVGSQWGDVRSFAKGRPIDPGPPPFGDPTAASYKQAAVAVIRASSRAGTAIAGSSPADWNARANTVRDSSLQRDLKRYVALNGALNDAAIATYGAKRKYQSPRPISMIRYLAFAGQLPLVPGLIEVRNGKVQVRLEGRWVLGAGWTPPAPTPASPGWVSEASAFSYAAADVLTALTGRSFTRQAEQFSRGGVAGGIETPADMSAGRALGKAVGKRALAQALR
ncbi:MAG: hypothetical protein QOE29_502, partial [Gaiellaceae bacterium]|nr:hypothetical protein [Gaiellaceae bacterium]